MLFISANSLLQEGQYEYKYIVDGEWIYNKNESVTKANKDGHINNYVQVFSKELGSYSQELREQLARDGDLTNEERLKIRQFLEAYSNKE
ncbi:Phosphoglucan phosphatase DSP4, amyloplastic [Thalictrum thalictroides]|uniref:Phosphoglucan phosphatase DSP4, amyloplastic n=1 Tax=Thalictrum thalictroides TaxID=46969 RepID=A0A7J6VWZ4_THATH|nr:Phosphoglucan phosphatase DSP4, amyloplastic [Thalictrum thalictroides]